MSVAKLSRSNKRQLGQFFTPRSVSRSIIERLDITMDQRVLEPSFGTGSFVFGIIDTLMQKYSIEEVRTWIQQNFYGCEIDEAAMATFSVEWQKKRKLGKIGKNIVRKDFFRWLPSHIGDHVALDKTFYQNIDLQSFDLIVGNPPFGGSFDPDIQDRLDAIFGTRMGLKIKKETYAFFIVKCVDLLKENGKLCFICSDTILTIPTMKGLRHWLHSKCKVEIADVPGLFQDTVQNMILITLTKKSSGSEMINVFGQETNIKDILLTPNYSWRVNDKYAKYFHGPLVGSKLVATSGMTTGNNKLFLRQMINGSIQEPYFFELLQEPITLEKELLRTRTGKLSVRKMQEIRKKEVLGENETVLKFMERRENDIINIPHEDYKFYNKASKGLIYTKPEWVIFWKDNGRYVYTYKKTGKWYLHGVGGKSYFEREGITWNLIASRLHMKWLPSGYILDSGAPCAFPREGIHRDELFFIMGWTLTDLCTDILKYVLNHTRNIQGKDLERLPYPYWVDIEKKRAAINHVKTLVTQARDAKKSFDYKNAEIVKLNDYYLWSK